MLDAGHYGKYNRSPCDKKYYESERMWLLHKMLGDALLKRGHTVGYTRKEQKKDLEVYQRGKKAKGYDLFLSCHSNAVGGGQMDKSVDYPKVYRSVCSDSDSVLLAQKLSDAVALTMGCEDGGKSGTKKGSDGKDYLGVLRGAAAVGCKYAYLVEHSFHTHPAATAFLLSDENICRLAIAEAEVIDQFFRTKPKVYFAIPTGYTGHSISAALKRIGENNSLSYRKKIGKLNGIEGVGTAKGNTLMLKLLMAGKLVKEDK